MHVEKRKRKERDIYLMESTKGKLELPLIIQGAN
jgi:hypothetical protein